MIGSPSGCEMVVDVAPLPLTTEGGSALTRLAISQSSTLRQACPAVHARMHIYVCMLCLRPSTLHVARCGCCAGSAALRSVRICRQQRRLS